MNKKIAWYYDFQALTTEQGILSNYIEGRKKLVI